MTDAQQIWRLMTSVRDRIEKDAAKLKERAKHCDGLINTWLEMMARAKGMEDAAVILTRELCSCRQMFFLGDSSGTGAQDCPVDVPANTTESAEAKPAGGEPGPEA